MKTIIMLLLCLGFAKVNTAQSIEKFSIDSGGASLTVASLELIYTIGEVNLSERISSTISISEGFINGNIVSILGINETEITAQKLRIYPNPTSENINIWTDIEFIKIELYDALGKRVLESDYLNRIQVNNLKSGIYILRLFNSEISITKRVIIE